MRLKDRYSNTGFSLIEKRVIGIDGYNHVALHYG